MHMTPPPNGWRDLFRTGGIATTIFIGGIALQAVEVFIGSSMLPTVVAEIGGLDLFAWNTTLFIVASILASLFAGIRPASIGPRGAYLMAAGAFALGSLICGLAPNMPVLLAGRTVQGFGAGLMIAMTLAMLRLVFPQALWPRAMALNSAVWGIATLLGPALGGIFAELGIWRWAFLSIVPLAGLLALGAWHILPRSAERTPMASVPWLQVGLVTAAVLAISLASLVTDSTPLAAMLLLAGLLSIALLGLADRRARAPLLPAGTFSASSSMSALFASIVLLGAAITSDIFAPLFLQRLHGLSPLWAGYGAALASAGWTVAAITTSGWGAARIRLAIIASPVVILAATLGMLVSLGQPNTSSHPLPLLVASLSLFALGAGIGMAFQHLSTGVLKSTAAAVNDKVSSAIGMTQLFASGLGAALGGVVVNAAGLPAATTPAATSHAAIWLFAAFAVISALAVPFALRAANARFKLAAIQPAE